MKLTKAKCSIDMVKVTSTTRISLGCNCLTLPKYKKLKKSNKGYVFLHKTTENIVLIIPTSGKDLFFPSITVKFLSSWLSPLTFEEVVDVLNFLTSKFKIGWNLAEFHVALDLFCSEGGTAWIKDHTAALKSRGPKEDEKYPEMYHFQGLRASYRQEVYNKSRQLLERYEKELEKPAWMRRTYLDDAALEELLTHEIVRMEARFNNTALGLVPSVESLASWDFSFISPKYLSILVPDYEKLAKRGIKPKDYKGLSLAETKRFFTAKGIQNHGDYLKDSPLNTVIKETLAGFRWCSTPEAHPLITPSLRMRDQGVRFVSQKGWWKNV